MTLLRQSWLALLLLAGAGCLQATPSRADTPVAAAAQIKGDAAAFIEETRALVSVARAFQDGRATEAALQAQLKRTRLAYKRVEFMLEYYYPEHIKAYVNGPPLPHPDPYPYREIPLPVAFYDNSDYINIAPLDSQEPNAFLKPRNVVEPQGLQVLDEIVFSENARSEVEKTVQLAEALVERSRIVVQALSKRKYIEDYQIIEATRLELVRIFSLGITGFDTPGSLGAIDEAATALSALARAVEATIGKQAEIDKLFSVAAAMLEGQRFEKLDRLRFLIGAMNPLYEALGRTHQQMSFKNSRDLTHEAHAWNPESRNLFADDFLNAYAYTLLRPQQDSDALQALGRKMFFDTALGTSRSMSCSTCHTSARAFTTDVPRSFERNAPTLVNAVFADRFFYDLRAFSLEEQITHVFENPQELDTHLDIAAAGVSKRADYRPLIAAAFGEAAASINRYQLLSALTSYVLSLRSFNSPFDRYVRGETPRLDPLAAQGFNLFMGKAACGTCHYAPTFSGLVPPLYRESESEVLGVMQGPDGTRLDTDPGRARNGRPEDRFAIFDRAFKTTTVRNVELTAPYFHNGAYRTLDEVIDFYDKGGARGMHASDLPNQTLAEEPLHLSEDEKQALKRFLLSLTDRCSLSEWRAPDETQVPKPAECNTALTRP